MAIKENIKILRKRYDLTQQELADIAGVTNKAVWAWENGLSEPRMGAIERIANHFGLKKSNIIEEGGMDAVNDNDIETIAAHREGDDEWTEEELKLIEEFKEFVRSQRKQRKE